MTLVVVFGGGAAEANYGPGMQVKMPPPARVPLAEPRFFPSLTKPKFNIIKNFRGIFAIKVKER